MDLGDNFQAGWRSAVSDQFMLSTLGAAQKQMAVTLPGTVV